MRDVKAFASLSSGLLARKGQARPAMRPQGFAPSFSAQDDLGWNDMGDDAPRVAGAVLPAELAGPAPAAAVVVELPQVIRQQEEIAREFSAPDQPVEPAAGEPVGFVPAARPRRKSDHRPVAAPREATGIVPRPAVHKAAFTLRLDADRHLRLRLACAVQHRSAQQIVVEALDRLLADLPEVARLAASLPQQD